MKPYLTVLFSLFVAIAMFAQSQTSFKYQAVVRNSEGFILEEETISMRISIIQGSAEGTTVCVETYNPTTNNFGLVNLMIGSQNTVDFSNIDWSNGPYFVKVEMDEAGGSDFTETGTTQLLSVPYALYAEKVGDPGIDGTESSFDGWDKDMTDDFSGDFNDLINIPINLDTDNTDDFDGNFSSLSGIPTGLSDGDDNTQLTESQVDTYVSNNNYLTTTGGNMTGNLTATEATNISGFNAAIISETNTTHILTSSDNGKVISLNNAGDITLTIPAGLPEGFNCLIVQAGEGQITFAASGTTIQNRQNKTKTAGQYAIATIIHLGSNIYVTSGDME